MCSRKQLLDAHQLGKMLNAAVFFGKTRYLENVLGFSNGVQHRNEREYSTNSKKLIKSLVDENLNCAKNLENEECDITTKLINWAMKHNISYSAFSQLLNALRECGVKNLPQNSRELLKAKEDEIKESLVPPGIYTHFGFGKNLKKVILALNELKVLHQTDIKVSIFIDNLPLSTFTRQGLWPILGSVIGFNNVIFLIGAYHGYAKPKSSNLFLTDFINEAKNLSKNGLEVNKINYSVTVKRLICDAPAKAFLLDIKGFSGYSSCTKCHAVGEYMKKRICFPEKSTPKTDKDFEKDDIYQREKTKLLEIPNFGLVSNIPLDYLHLVCLGIVNKLISIWWGEKKNYWVSKQRVSELMKSLPSFSPCEFHVKPKPLGLFSRWTSFESRQFLLYHGPVVLRNNLSEKYYNHFLSLHVACRLFCMEGNQKLIETGNKLLETFVRDFIKFYGKEQITHCIHGLYHLADDYHSHGTLDSFSAFPFEKFLLQLRNSMKKIKRKSLPKMILTHSYEKIFTKNLKNLRTSDYEVSKKLNKTDETLPGKFKNFSNYEILTIRNADVVLSKNADKYVCLKNGKVVEVTGILSKKEKSGKICFIAGKEFASVSSFYKDPLESCQLNVFSVKNLSNVVNYWPVDLIHRKCMKISVGNECVAIGLLEQDY